MAAGYGVTQPTCGRCGKKLVGHYRRNTLIGGDYCIPCDDIIQKRDPKLEARWEARRAKQLASG